MKIENTTISYVDWKIIMFYWIREVNQLIISNLQFEIFQVSLRFQIQNYYIRNEVKRNNIHDCTK